MELKTESEVKKKKLKNYDWNIFRHLVSDEFVSVESQVK